LGVNDVQALFRKVKQGCETNKERLMFIKSERSSKERLMFIKSERSSRRRARI
jgi:hypothetical protein